MSIDYSSIKKILDKDGIQAGVRVLRDGTIMEISVPNLAESHSAAYEEGGIWKFEGHWLGAPFHYEGWDYEVQESNAYITDGFIAARLDTIFATGAIAADIGVTTITTDPAEPGDEPGEVWVCGTRDVS